MPRKIASFCILLALGWAQSQGCEPITQTDESLYQKAISTSNESKLPPDLQDRLIHQLLYEHYSLTPEKIKPCISLTRLCNLVNNPLHGIEDKIGLRAKTFFLKYGKDLLGESWSISFEDQQFYQDTKTFENTPTYVNTVEDSYLASTSCFFKGLLLNDPRCYEETIRFYPLAEAYFELGQLSERGIKGTLLVTAKDLYMSAAENDPRAAFALSRICESEKKLEEAFNWALKAAMIGHSQAQFKVARYYHKALGTAQNDIEARRWYDYSRKQGNCEADVRFARLLWLGKGGDVDLQGAFEIYKRLATHPQNPHAKANYYVGWFYREGIHVTQNKKEAKSYLEKAAKLGSYKAWNCLGTDYFEDSTDRGAYEKAIDLYRKRKNKPHLICNLANTYVGNKKFDVDLKKAEELLKEVAEDSRAQFLLGYIAEKKGEQQKAKELYLTSANKGYADAFYYLACLEKHPQIFWNWGYSLAMQENGTRNTYLQDRFKKDFWLDRYLLTLQAVDTTGLESTLKNAFDKLQDTAQGSPIKSLISALSIPFDCLKTPGSLITCVVFNTKELYEEQFHLDAGCQPFIFDNQPYLVLGNASVKRMNGFISQLEAIVGRFNTVHELESTLKADDKKKYREVQAAYNAFTQAWDAFIYWTVLERNQLFFKKFNGVLWSATGTSCDESCVWYDSADNKYRQDYYQHQMKSNNADGLKRQWEDSLDALKAAAKGTIVQENVSSIEIPFKLFQKMGFLISIFRIGSPDQFQEAEFKPVPIGPQYYLIEGTENATSYCDFLSKIIQVVDKLKKLDALGDSVEKEAKEKYSLVKESINTFHRAQIAYIKGTAPDRNKTFFTKDRKGHYKL